MTKVYYDLETDQFYLLNSTIFGLIMWTPLEGGFWMLEEWLKGFTYLGEL